MPKMHPLTCTMAVDGNPLLRGHSGCTLQLRDEGEAPGSVGDSQHSHKSGWPEDDVINQRPVNNKALVSSAAF